jgi:hypothetical protein
MEIIMAETMFSKESAKRQKEELKKHADVGHAEAVQAEKKINVNFYVMLFALLAAQREKSTML